MAEELVRTGLIACANILPGIVSVYIWQDRLERETEVAMVMKTRQALAARVITEMRRLHPYENPAIVALPIVAGSPDFLGWVAAQTASADKAAP